MGEDKVPQTLEELKSWYKYKNLPDENITRFFIGKDIAEPKVFGIYQDMVTYEFVVYKNKADGERAERYRGQDEAYACGIYYQRLVEEMAHQKKGSDYRGVSSNFNNSRPYRSNSVRSAARITNTFWVFMIIVVILMVILVAAFLGTSNRSGYYYYGDDYYYYYSGDWYEYDDYYGWSRCYSAPYGLRHNCSDYYVTRDYYDYDFYNYGITDFTYSDAYYDARYNSRSSYYDDDDDYDYDYDSSSSWDSWDSWDSSSTDWDSDW